jgi:hypothetical protein
MVTRTLILRCLHIRQPLLRPGTPTILAREDNGIAYDSGDLAAGVNTELGAWSWELFGGLSLWGSWDV